jgi:NAD-specific glutamate dehydrogenase
MTRNIPPEYLAFRNENDFGFSAVDEAEVTHVTDENTLETKIIRESATASAEGVQRLEQKIDTILNLYNEGKLGLDAEKEKLESEVKSRLVELEQLIMPLLVNLMKNPDKEYIYWPNRKDKIQEQIDRVLKLTRG